MGLLTFLLVTNLVFATASKSPCLHFKKCDCLFAPPEVIVNCEGRGLWTMPDDIPQETTKLYLSHNNLRSLGQLNLPNLHELYVHENQLIYISTKAFLNSSKLVVLDLSKNSLKDDGAHWDLVFNNTPHLQQLNLNANHLSQFPAVTNAKSLGSLSLANNSLTSSVVPASYMKLTNLKDLDLSSNNISSVQDHSFDALKNANMRELFLRNNSIRILSVRAIQSLQNLRTLDISENLLSDTGLHLFICSLKLKYLSALYLDKLKIKSNEYFYPLMRCMSNFPLNKLSLRDNSIVRIFNGDLDFFLGLNQLFLSGNRMIKTGDEIFKNTTQLQDLQLDRCSLTLEPRNLPATLLTLNLNNNYLVKIYKNVHKHMQNLKELLVRSNRLKQIQFGAFEGLKKLKKLDLSDNRLQVLDPRTFIELTDLRVLLLKNNRIKTLNGGGELFEQQGLLEQLDLSYNGIEQMDKDILKLPNLKTLSLNENNFNLIFKLYGNESSEIFQNLPSLQNLTLKKNSLDSDVIPDGVFAPLENLRDISLGGNFLSNLIPFAFSSTQKVTWMNFKDNSIFNVRQEDIQIHSSLEHLNLYGNLFICDCNLDWFVNWINNDSRTVDLVHLDRLICGLPPPYSNYRVMDFKPEPCPVHKPHKPHPYALIAGLTAAVLVLIIILIVLVRDNYKLHRFRRIMIESPHEDDDEGSYLLPSSSYDSYFCYAPDAQEFLDKHFSTKVGNTVFSHFGDRVFTHDRIILGDDEYKARGRAMRRCRVMVVVITKDLSKTIHSCCELEGIRLRHHSRQNADEDDEDDFSIFLIRLSPEAPIPWPFSESPNTCCSRTSVTGQNVQVLDWDEYDTDQQGRCKNRLRRAGVDIKTAAEIETQITAATN